MAISIHTNIGSQFAQRAMSNAQNSVRTNIERLSSGIRINTAADDSAGLSISSRMTSHIRSSVPLMRGINDGVSLLQVAGSGLRSTLECLQRARELSVQAGNSILTTSDREALNAEYQQMMVQVNHVANTTEAFGIFPLKGKPISAQIQDNSSVSNGTTPHITDIFPTSGASYGGSSGIKPIAYIPQGATDINIEIDCIGMDDDIQIFTADGKHLLGTPLTDTTWTSNNINNSSEIKSEVLKGEYGFESYAAYDATDFIDGSQKFVTDIKTNPSDALSGSFNGMNFSYSGDGDYHDATPNDGTVSVDTTEKIYIDKTTEPLIIVITGQGSFNATASWGTMPAKGTPVAPASLAPKSEEGLHILTSATPSMAPTFVTIEKTPTDTKNLGLVGTALNPLDEVMLAIDALDAAINQVSNYAVKHGAVEARLDQAASNAAVSSDATSAARSRIMDADFATETAQLASQMIRSSASTAMSAQANLTPKLVLALLGSTAQKW